MRHGNGTMNNNYRQVVIELKKEDNGWDTPSVLTSNYDTTREPKKEPTRSNNGESSHRNNQNNRIVVGSLTASNNVDGQRNNEPKSSVVGGGWGTPPASNAANGGGGWGRQDTHRADNSKPIKSRIVKLNSRGPDRQTNRFSDAERNKSPRNNQSTSFGDGGGWGKPNNAVKDHRNGNNESRSKIVEGGGWGSKPQRESPRGHVDHSESVKPRRVEQDTSGPSRQLNNNSRDVERKNSPDTNKSKSSADGSGWGTPKTSEKNGNQDSIVLGGGWGKPNTSNTASGGGGWGSQSRRESPRRHVDRSKSIQHRSVERDSSGPDQRTHGSSDVEKKYSPHNEEESKSNGRGWGMPIASENDVNRDKNESKSNVIGGWGTPNPSMAASGGSGWGSKRRRESPRHDDHRHDNSESIKRRNVERGSSGQDRHTNNSSDVEGKYYPHDNESTIGIDGENWSKLPASNVAGGSGGWPSKSRRKSPSPDPRTPSSVHGQLHTRPDPHGYGSQHHNPDDEWRRMPRRDRSQSPRSSMRSLSRNLGGSPRRSRSPQAVGNWRNREPSMHANRRDRSRQPKRYPSMSPHESRHGPSRRREIYEEPASPDFNVGRYSPPRPYGHDSYSRGPSRARSLYHESSPPVFGDDMSRGRSMARRSPSRANRGRSSARYSHSSTHRGPSMARRSPSRSSRGWPQSFEDPRSSRARSRSIVRPMGGTFQQWNVPYDGPPPGYFDGDPAESMLNGIMGNLGHSRNAHDISRRSVTRDSRSRSIQRSRDYMSTRPIEPPSNPTEWLFSLILKKMIVQCRALPVGLVFNKQPFPSTVKVSQLPRLTEFHNFMHMDHKLECPHWVYELSPPSRADMHAYTAFHSYLLQGRPDPSAAMALDMKGYKIIIMPPGQEAREVGYEGKKMIAVIRKNRRG